MLLEKTVEEYKKYKQEKKDMERANKELKKNLTAAEEELNTQKLVSSAVGKRN